MESALYGIFTLVGFVSEISLVRCAHSFDFRYFTNLCENPVRMRFPWSNLYLLYRHKCFPGKYTTHKNSWETTSRIQVVYNSLVYDWNIFGFSLKVFGILREILEMFGKCSGKYIWPSEQFWKIFGNLRKVVGNLRKIIKIAVISMCTCI